MELTAPRSKSLFVDGLCWTGAMLVLAGIAFFLLSREAQKHYGTIAFGGFPDFEAVETSGKNFDQHRLHGQLSAVVVADQNISKDTLLYLHKLSQGTAVGRKYLHNLIMSNEPQGVSDQWVQHLILTEAHLARILEWREKLFKKGVILVDQNGIIRGGFNIDDKLDRINFEGAVRGIL